MGKEIGKLEHEYQIITKDGKYFGYGDDVNDRAWCDDPVKAIAWNLKLDDVNKIYSPTLDLNNAILLKVKKTIIIETYE